MDPITAALQLAAQIVKITGEITVKLIDGATPEQKQQLVEFHIKHSQRYEDFLARVAGLLEGRS